jgi:inositol oxygenase
MNSSQQPDNDTPLDDLQEWEDDVLRRYPEPENRQVASPFTDPGKKESEFRNYKETVRDSVKEFYRLNHVHQTVEFVKEKRAEFLPLEKRRLGVWQALEHLNSLAACPDTCFDLDIIGEVLY